jgi:hypothetical protein
MSDEDEQYEHDERAASLESEVIALMEELVQDYDYQRVDLDRLVEAATR